jgi:hypothetical protein
MCKYAGSPLTYWETTIYIYIHLTKIWFIFGTNRATDRSMVENVLDEIGEVSVFFTFFS